MLRSSYGFLFSAFPSASPPRNEYWIHPRTLFLFCQMLNPQISCRSRPLQTSRTTIHPQPVPSDILSKAPCRFPTGGTRAEHDLQVIILFHCVSKAHAFTMTWTSCKCLQAQLDKRVQISQWYALDNWQKRWKPAEKNPNFFLLLFQTLLFLDKSGDPQCTSMASLQAKPALPNN